jgi:predicted MFS family arabinose efflux permease
MVAFTTTGTIGFATSRTARGHHGTPSPRGRFTILATPGMRIVLASTVTWGATFGGLDVSLPAFADERGSAATGGVLLTVLSLGVAIGTFVYGTRRSDRPVERRLLIASGVGAATFAPLALASETWQLALLVFVTGLAIAPPTVCTWLILAQVAPPSARTEAGTWISSAVAVGVAIGATAVGAIVDTVGARTALLAAFASSSLGVVILLLRERELRPAVAA